MAIKADQGKRWAVEDDKTYGPNVIVSPKNLF